MMDRTNAEALRIAHLHLIKMGWKFSPEDIGATAGRIIAALDAKEPSP